MNNNDFIHNIDGKYTVITLFIVNNASRIGKDNKIFLNSNLEVFLSII
jgi:hypothetical protein